VEIPLDSISARINLGDNAVCVVQTAAGEEIPSQVTSDGKLIFQPALQAGQAKQFYVSSGSPASSLPKVWGRLMPERYDDFAWENDRVVFRVYAQKLIAKDGASNGIDIWYKYTDKFIMESKISAYLSGKNSYHNDNNDGGMDDYNVGHSLGAGAAAPFVDGKLWLNDNFVQSEALDSGPLRIRFKLIYNNLEVNGKTMSETRIISLDAGSQLSKIQQFYGNDQTMPVAVGIVRVEGDTAPVVNFDNAYMIYRQPATAKAEGVYVGVILTDPTNIWETNTYTWFNPVKKNNQTFSHNLLVVEKNPSTPITYYAGYGWSRHGFPTIADFETYIKNFSQGLKEPLIVTYAK
jgi:hypothetical protein